MFFRDRDPSEPPARSPTVLASYGLSVLDAAIAALLLLALGAMAVPRPVTGQSAGQSAEARASARIRVPAVATVEPEGTVRVSFPDRPAGAVDGSERWVEAGRTIRVRCASNAPHRLRVRRTGGDLPPGARIQWSADSGESWKDLRAVWRPVRARLPAGDHRDCVSLRHRLLVPAGRAGPAEVGSVALALSVDPFSAVRSPPSGVNP